MTYETLTKVLCCGWTVRVWRAAPDAAYGPDEEIRMALGEEAWHEPSDIAEKLDSMSGITCYEILDDSGSGMVVYP